MRRLRRVVSALFVAAGLPDQDGEADGGDHAARAGGVEQAAVQGAGYVTGLFPPQQRDWGLPVEANLSPKAASRVGREAATQSFDNAARALNLDWGTGFDGKQLQRWGMALAGRCWANARPNWPRRSGA